MRSNCVIQELTTLFFFEVAGMADVFIVNKCKPWVLCFYKGCPPRPLRIHSELRFKVNFGTDGMGQQRHFGGKQGLVFQMFPGTSWEIRRLGAPPLNTSWPATAQTSIFNFNILVTARRGPSEMFSHISATRALGTFCRNPGRRLQCLGDLQEMCVYIYIYIHVYDTKQKSIYMYTNTCVYPSIHPSIYVSMCMYVCMYYANFACVYIYIYTYTSIRLRGSASIRTFSLKSTQIHSSPLKFTQNHSNPLKSTQIHSNSLKSTQVHSNSLKFTQVHSKSNKIFKKSVNLTKLDGACLISISTCRCIATGPR